MLYDLMIHGEDARWEKFKKAEREAQYRSGLRDGTVGRLRGVRMLDAARTRAGFPRALLGAALRR